MSSKNIQDLKDKIHYQVNELEDETTLQMLQEAVVAYSPPSKKDILDELTDDQKKDYTNLFNKRMTVKPSLTKK